MANILTSSSSSSALEPSAPSEHVENISDHIDDVNADHARAEDGDNSQNPDIDESHEEGNEDDDDPDSPPSNFICPLTLEIMSDPLMTCKNHLNFERSAIVEWLNRGNTTCPLTREPLSYSKLVPNAALRLQIEQWKRDHGIPVERLKSKREKWNEEQGGKISFYHGTDNYDDEDANRGFRITVASPLSYHQQLFMVAALGQEYSVEERRQLMDEYRRYSGIYWDEDDEDLPIATLFYAQEANNNRRSRRRRGRRNANSLSSNPRQEGSTPDNSDITPRRRRRLLSVIDNALSMLRGPDIHND